MASETPQIDHDSYSASCGFNGCTKQGCVAFQGMCKACFRLNHDGRVAAAPKPSLPRTSQQIVSFVHDSYTAKCGYQGCTKQGCVPCQGRCMSCYKKIRAERDSLHAN